MGPETPSRKHRGSTPAALGCDGKCTHSKSSTRETEPHQAKILLHHKGQHRGQRAAHRTEERSKFVFVFLIFFNSIAKTKELKTERRTSTDSEQIGLFPRSQANVQQVWKRCLHPKSSGKGRSKLWGKDPPVLPGIPVT